MLPFFFNLSLYCIPVSYTHLDVYKRQEIDADLVMASDPDADRVGIACKDDKGEWVLINGNQTCMMSVSYTHLDREYE